MNHRMIFAATCLSSMLVGCTGDTGAEGPAGQPGPVGEPGPAGGFEADLPAVDKLVEALGGETALTALAGYEVEMTGWHLVNHEGEFFDQPALGNFFTMTVARDIASDRQRVDVDRDLEFFPIQAGVSTEADRQVFTYFITEQGAWIEGRDNNELPPAAMRYTMPSPQYGAYTKQLSVLLPHRLIQQARDNTVDGGFTLWEGASHHSVLITLDIGSNSTPVELLIHAQTGQLSALRFAESEYFRRDIEVVYQFAGWQKSGDGLAFPRTVFVSVEGVQHAEFRTTSFAANPTFAADHFTAPADAVFALDAAESERGGLNSQLHLTIAAVGIDLDKPALDVIATPILDSEGNEMSMWYVTGADTRHHSMIVEQETGVVLFDAPVRPERADNIVTWVAENIGKPVTHLVISHHHTDHAAGSRSVVAAGAAAVSFVETRRYYENAFNASSSVIPDALGQNGAPNGIRVLTVKRLGVLDLDDTINPIRVYHVPTPHADDMIMPVATNRASGESVGFTVDIWNPAPFNFSFPEWAIPLRQHFTDFAIATENLRLAGGHGGIGPFSDFQQFIDALPQ